MRIFAIVLLLNVALPVFANGTWHGAYIGKGTATATCGVKDFGSEKFISTMDRSDFDLGTYFYYGLRFTETEKIISYDVTLSRDWKVVFGNAGVTSGSHTSYEDCPGRDICEGECCEVEGNDDSSTHPNINATNSKTYPTKTEVRLKLDDGGNAHLTWTQENKHRADINLDGKITYPDSKCEITWKDKMVWKDKKPDEIKDTLHCLAGACRWKKPQ